MTLSQRIAQQIVSQRLRTNSAAYPATAWWSGGARPKQLPPDGDWRIWLILSGRGFGKSRAVNEWAIERARRYPGSRGALVAATASDVRDVVVEGESGILNICADGFRPEYEPSKRRLTFPNGSIATTFSADEPNRLRGPQFHWAICDELAAWREAQETFDMLMLCVRLGVDPRIAIATTPRPTTVIKAMLKDPTCVIARGTTHENAANLAPAFLTEILGRYEGTRLGRQEIEGEILDDVIGALWKRHMIASVDEPPQMKRIVVAIDPAVTNTETSDETGIVVAGVGVDGKGYVLDDLSLKASPDGWARRAISAYHSYNGDRILAETNNGGEMVQYTLRTVDPRIPFKAVHASRGKQTRAEPIAALYEQGKVLHVGAFRDLEDQMCTWIPGDGNSPDRVDALVWALSELMLRGGLKAESWQG